MAISAFCQMSAVVEGLKQQFVPKYQTMGEVRFYTFLLFYGLNKLLFIQKGTYKGTSPELQLMDYYDQFLFLYRREGEEIYLDLARVFMKAGNKIYRVMLKNKLIEKNTERKGLLTPV